MSGSTSGEKKVLSPMSLDRVRMVTQGQESGCRPVPTSSQWAQMAPLTSSPISSLSFHTTAALLLQFIND